LGEITVKDNGIGLPQNLAEEQAPSMGLHLVNVLVEQLQGQLQISREGGTSFRVQFPLSGSVSGLSENGSNSYR
jgi:two-component sensor histidine kinase